MSEPRSYHDGRVHVYGGDCREILGKLPADHFDAVCVDPPYHFASIVKRFGGENAAEAKSSEATGVYKRASCGFMGKQWDGGQIAHEPETWAAVLRVMKPGAHLVGFHAPKNWHRLVVAIEDAGFEIRDNLLWLFGSGFPKSHDVSKAIDKTLGVEREIIGERKLTGTARIKGGGGYTIEHAQENYIGAELRETLSISAPTSDLAKQYNGFGTALKPAYEPIVLARKPLVGTIAANVMAHGTGAINIDACRVGGSKARRSTNGGLGCKANPVYGEFSRKKVEEITTTLGRWPANIIHDGSDEVVSGFPDTGPSSAHLRGEQHSGRHGGLSDLGANFKDGTQSVRGPDDNGGSAARFFYTAKANADDRIGSKHPTVKPLDLMQWLVRLVTPPKGHILDIFAGTGTTAEAALREGFRCTLIEREAEYLADIDRRMAHIFDGEVGRSVAMAKARGPRPDDPAAPLLDYIEAGE